MHRLMVVGIVLLLTVSISKTRDIKVIKVQYDDDDDEGNRTTTTMEPREIETPETPEVSGAVDLGLLGRKVGAGAGGAAKAALSLGLAKERTIMGAIGGGLSGGIPGIIPGATAGAVGCIKDAEDGLTAAFNQD